MQRWLDLFAALARQNEKLEKIMSAQSDVDAAVAALQSFLADVAVAVQDIKAELSGSAVDTSALDSVVAQLPAVQASLDALEAPASTSTSTAAGAGPLAPGLV
jgi:predicted RNA-binding Zn ribbon-like protein